VFSISPSIRCKEKHERFRRRSTPFRRQSQRDHGLPWQPTRTIGSTTSGSINKEEIWVRISAQRIYIDPQDEGSDGSAFGRSLLTAAANTHIRTTLSLTPSTQVAQAADIDTIKTCYAMQFKSSRLAEAARNREWLNALGNDMKTTDRNCGAPNPYDRIGPIGKQLHLYQQASLHIVPSTILGDNPDHKAIKMWTPESQTLSHCISH
jgi:hypothetical protein